MYHPKSFDPRIAPEPFDWEIIHQAHAAKNLQGLIRDTANISVA